MRKGKPNQSQNTDAVALNPYFGGWYNEDTTPVNLGLAELQLQHVNNKVPRSLNEGKQRGLCPVFYIIKTVTTQDEVCSKEIEEVLLGSYMSLKT